MQNYNSKLKIKSTLKDAIGFHGHLGPYLVLGLLMGDSALKKLEWKKYSGINTLVKGAENKPKSCLIDGLQISTGCTYGKGNIAKGKGKEIEVLIKDLTDNKRLKISLKDSLIKRLDSLEGHRDSELFAKKLLKLDPETLFNFKF